MVNNRLQQFVNLRRWIGSLFVGPRGFLWLIFPIQRRTMPGGGVYRLQTSAALNWRMEQELALCRARSLPPEYLLASNLGVR